MLFADGHVVLYLFPKEISAWGYSPPLAANFL